MYQRFNITKYIDNDRDLLPTLNGRYHLPSCKPYVYKCKKLDNGYEFETVLAANCLMPSVHFTIKYEVVKNELQITINYKIADYIQNLLDLVQSLQLKNPIINLLILVMDQMKVILINISIQNMDIMKLQQKKIMI